MPISKSLFACLFPKTLFKEVIAIVAGIKPLITCWNRKKSKETINKVMLCPTVNAVTNNNIFFDCLMLYTAHNATKENMVIPIEVGYVLKTKFQIEFKRMHIIFLTDKSLSFYLASRFLTFPHNEGKRYCSGRKKDL